MCTVQLCKHSSPCWTNLACVELDNLVTLLFDLMTLGQCVPRAYVDCIFTDVMLIALVNFFRAETGRQDMSDHPNRMLATTGMGCEN